MTWSHHSSSPTSPNGHNAKKVQLDALLSQLNQLDEHPLAAVRSLFDPKTPLAVGRAPGRLDVMGGIADYSGSLVLQLPIREATFADNPEKARTYVDHC